MLPNPSNLFWPPLLTNWGQKSTDSLAVPTCPLCIPSTCAGRRIWLHIKAVTFARCQEDAESVDSAHGKEIARLLEQERNFLLLTLFVHFRRPAHFHLGRLVKITGHPADGDQREWLRRRQRSLWSGCRQQYRPCPCMSEFVGYCLTA